LPAIASFSAEALAKREAAAGRSLIFNPFPFTVCVGQVRASGINGGFFIAPRAILIILAAMLTNSCSNKSRCMVVGK